MREGNLEAPTRHPIDWKNPEFYNEQACEKELERIFDICHGCRRCVSLCNAFPLLFDMIDEAGDLETAGVPKEKFWKVVDQCYLCDVCYMTKCPYVPPHQWNLDFPHTMLRAKAIQYKTGKMKFRDKLLTSTELVGTLSSIPVVAQVVNAANKFGPARAVLQKVLGVDVRRELPEFDARKVAAMLEERGLSGVPCCSRRWESMRAANCPSSTRPTSAPKPWPVTTIRFATAPKVPARSRCSPPATSITTSRASATTC